MAGSLADSTSTSTPTLKEQEAQINLLQRENFNLKLEISKLHYTLEHVASGSMASDCSAELHSLKESKKEVDLALLSAQDALEQMLQTEEALKREKEALSVQMKHSLDQMLSEIGELKHQKGSLSRDLEHLALQNRQLAKEVEEGRERERECERECERERERECELQKTLHEQSICIQDLTVKNAELAGRNNELVKHGRGVQLEVEALKRKVGQNAELERVNAELERVKGKLTERNAELEQVNGKLSEQNAQVRHRCTELEQKCTELEQKHSEQKCAGQKTRQLEQKSIEQKTRQLEHSEQKHTPSPLPRTSSAAQTTKLELMLDSAAKFKQKLAHSFPECSTLLLDDQNDDLFISQLLCTCKSLVVHFERSLMQMYSQIPNAPRIVRFAASDSLLQTASLAECKAYVDSVLEGTLNSLSAMFQDQNGALQQMRDSLERVQVTSAKELAELNAKVQFYAAKIAKYRAVLHKKEHFIVKALEQLEVLSSFGNGSLAAESRTLQLVE